jgi:hypothetical protein
LVAKPKDTLMVSAILEAGAAAASTAMAEPYSLTTMRAGEFLASRRSWLGELSPREISPHARHRAASTANARTTPPGSDGRLQWHLEPAVLGRTESTFRRAAEKNRSRSRDFDDCSQFEEVRHKFSASPRTADFASYVPKN